MATTEPSSLPAAAEAANVNTLTTALEETHITETGKDTKTEAKANGEDDLEEGEIRDEEEVDDGKPKTVFDSKKNYNLKVGLSLGGDHKVKADVKHPLFTRWTLYFDSPQSKMLPKTPGSTPATPQIANGASPPVSQCMIADE